MSEFFYNIGVWFAENRDNILTFVTSTNFVALLGLTFTILKDCKSRKNNTASVNNFSETLKAQNTSADMMNSLASDSVEVNAKMSEVMSRLAYVKTMQEEFNQKVDTLLEVFTIVYSTIKDDKIRNSVNTLLISAKHYGAQTKAELENEIKRLKQDLDKYMTMAKDKADEAVSKATSVITGVTEHSDGHNTAGKRY